MLPGSLLTCPIHPHRLCISDDGAHAVMVAAGEKMLVGDDLWAEYLQDSSNVLGMDRQTDRHVFIWGLIQRKYIDYNFQISKNFK